MKKLIILFLLVFVPIICFCSSPDWIEVQSVVVPKGTPLHHYYTKDGNVKYVLVISDINVPISVKNAENYLNGICKLEVVKWYSQVTKKYKYTTRQYKPNQMDIDLQTIFEGNSKPPVTFFKPTLNE